MAAKSSPQALNGDFQPEIKSIEQAEATILTINLPGFAKEQLRITFDESTRNMKVRGDRRLPDNRIIRFDKDFKIPENCKLNEMKAKFDQNQVLTVTMPKKTVTPVTAKESATGKMPQPVAAPPKPSVETKPPALDKPQGQGTDLPKNPRAADQSTKKPENEKLASSPSQRQDLPQTKSTKDTTTPKATAPKATTTASTSDQKQREEAARRPPTPQRRDTTKSSSRKDIEGAPPVAAKPDKFGNQTAKASPSKTGAADAGKSSTDHITSRKPSASAGRAEQKADDQQKGNNLPKEKGKSNQPPMSVDGLLGRTGDVAAVAERPVLGLDGERRLLVNAGVAVLVIAALGMYVSYKYGASGRRKD